MPSPQDLGKRICSDLSTPTYHLRLDAQAADSTFRSVVRIEGWCRAYSIELTLHTQVTLAIDQLPETPRCRTRLHAPLPSSALSNCLSKMFAGLKNVAVNISINF